MHELSSVDTLIDILGVSKALDSLGLFEDNVNIYCSRLPLGGGTIKAAHGTLPIPAPATLKILERSNLIVYGGPIEEEIVTPTGAALLSALRPKISHNDMELIKVTYSTGQKKFKDFLNVLRILQGEIQTENIKDKNHAFESYLEEVTILETDVDDVSGEIIGNFFKTLENENVLDIQIIPSTTKKNRPGHIIKVLCHPNDKFKIIEKIIEELGTLGVTVNTINRICVDRIIKTNKIEINGKDYSINYKISFVDFKTERKIINIKPEYEDLKKISNQTGLPVKKVLFYAQAHIQKLYESH